MLQHYLKVAVRNLLKYKMQSAISIVGLAIGFALVTLATYWNHYEKTYDAFHPNAERIHRVKMGGLGDMHFEQTDKYVKSYMEQTYPEVETACSMEYKLMQQHLDRRNAWVSHHPGNTGNVRFSMDRR